MYWSVISPFMTRIIAALTVLTALVGGGWYLHHSGYQSGYAVAEAIGQNNLNEYREAQRKLADAALAKQREIEDDLQTKLLQSLKEKEDAIKAINDTHERLVS